MTRASTIQTNFTAGELSPRLAARIDLARYMNGCEIMENFIPWVQGGATKRPGFKHVWTISNNTVVRLLPFRFSTEQTYCIEMGVGYFRFFRLGGAIVEAPIDSSTASPDELPTPYQISHGYTAEDIPNIRFTQSNDVLYLVHSRWPPHELRRLGDVNWEFRRMPFVRGPYLDINKDKSLPLESSRRDGPRNWVITAPHDARPESGVFASTDVGRWLRLYISPPGVGTPPSGGGWYDGQIISVAHPRAANVQFVEENTDLVFPATDRPIKFYIWRLGAWSDTTGWPKACTFYEERLWLGGSRTQPQAIWSSKSKDDFYSFQPTQQDGTVLDENATSYTIGADDVNKIRWMVPGKVLTLLTDSGEYAASSGATNEAITPRNIRVVRETARGAANIRPVVVDKSILFWQRAKTKLREYIYDFNVDGYKSDDLTILSEHITRGGIVDSCYQQEPNSIIWSAREDGQLIGLTYNKEQQVTGWHRHILGGVDPKVISLISLSSGDGPDELWIVSERTVEGRRLRCIERMEPEFNPADENDTDGFFLDAGLTYRGVALTTFTGLQHLAGEMVDILADGGVRPSVVVGPDGSIELDRPAGIVHVGLPYRAKIKSVRYEAGQNDGTSQSKTGRIHKLAIRMLHTLGVKYGPDDAHMDEVLFRNGSMPMGQSPKLFTGDKVVSFPGNNDIERRVVITSDQPYPCTILAIIPWMVVHN